MTETEELSSNHSSTKNNADALNITKILSRFSLKNYEKSVNNKWISDEYDTAISFSYHRYIIKHLVNYKSSLT